MNIIKSYIVTNAAASSGGGGGTGTVTSFSAGNLSPLFTTNVATATTTPALTFAAVNQNANLVYAGPATGIAAAPTFRALVAADIPITLAGYWKTAGTSTLTAATQIDTGLNGVNSLLIGDVGNDSGLHFNTVVGGYKYVLRSTSPLSPSGGGDGVALAIGDIYGIGDASYAGVFAGASDREISMSAQSIDGQSVELFFQANNAQNFDAYFDDARTTPRGLQYGGDYSAGYSTRSLVDQGYVLGAKTYTGQQTFSLTSLYAHNTGIDVVATGGSDILNIGTSNADVINIGYSGSTINITGTLAYQNVTNLQVTDKLFTVNKGGGVGSGVSSGFEIEENNVITGYFATNGTRDGWDFKAPAITGVANLSLASLTGNRTYTLPDATGTIALTSNIIGPANGGTGIANNAASTLTISGNFATTLTVSGVTGVTLPTSGTLATVAGTWATTGTSTLTGAVTIAQATNNIGFLNGNTLFGPTGATITASTRVDIRGTGTTTDPALRVANSSNTTRFTILDNGGISSTSSTGAATANTISMTTTGIGTIFDNTADGTRRCVSISNGSAGGSARCVLDFGNSANIGLTLSYTSVNFSGSLLGFTVGINTALIWNAQNAPLILGANATAFFRMDGTGRTFIGGSTTPTAVLHLAAGTATASTAPLKLTPGTNNTTAEAGAFEYNGTNLFFTRTGTTRQTVLTANVITTEVVVSDTTVTINVAGTDYKLLARA